MKFQILITLITFLQYNIVPAQNVISTGLPFGQKVYVDEMLTLKTASRSSLNGMIRTPIEREVKLKIIGPKNLTTGDHTLSIEFEIYPDNNNLYSLHNFDLGLISERGGVQCSDPAIRFMTSSDNQLTELEDRTKQAAYFYVGATAIYTYLKIQFPAIGLATSGSQLFGEFFNWLNTDNNNWLELWKNTYEYDYYPIPPPYRTNYYKTSNVKYVKIKVPIKVIDPQKEISLDINSLQVRNYNMNNDDDDWAYIANEKYILKKGIFNQPEPPQIISESNTVTHDLNIGNGLKGYLSSTSYISNEGGQNYLNVDLDPVNLSESQTLNIDVINLQILSLKGNIELKSLPSYSGSSGAYRYETLKQKAGEKLFANALFFLGKQAMSATIDETDFKTTLDVGSVLNDGNNIGTEFSENKMLVPYYDGLKKQWFTENYYDSYYLPSFRPNLQYSNSTKNGKISIRIPFTAYSIDPYIRLFLRCDVTIHTASGNKITSYSATTLPIRMWQVINFESSISSSITKSQNTSKVKLGFIIDSSGSMSSSDPKNIRKTGVEQILNVIDKTDDVLIVDFDDNAKWLNNNNYTNWNLASLLSDLNTIDANGGTNVGGGLAEMRNVLQSTNIISNVGVILLTDGKGDYNQQANWFAQNNIPVYTISYRNMADAKLMDAIAVQTNGIYTQANDESDVVSAFLAFYAKLKNNSQFISVKGSLNNCSTESKDFTVDNNTKEMIVSVNWENYPLNIELQNPYGKNIGEFSPSVQLTKGKNYKILKIKKPEAGDWNVSISCNGMPGKNPFLLEASGNSPLVVQFKGSLQQNGSIKIDLYDPQNLISASSTSAQINVQTPNNRFVDISNLYKNGSVIYYPKEGKGNYKFSTKLTGSYQNQKFQRSYKQTIFTGNFTPSFITNVKQITHNYLSAEFGSTYGIQKGMKCYIYESGGNKDNKKAEAIVSSVDDVSCKIQIVKFYNGTYRILPSDIVELDFTDWQNDLTN